MYVEMINSLLYFNFPHYYLARSYVYIGQVVLL